MNYSMSYDCLKYVRTVYITFLCSKLIHFAYFLGVGGYVAQDNTGHFGPFQSCKYTAYYSYCGGDHYYNNTSKGLFTLCTLRDETMCYQSNDSLITLTVLLKTKSGECSREEVPQSRKDFKNGFKK